MADAAVAIANKPAWVDLGSSDAAGSRDFYSKVFGWRVEVNPDPQYGGYGLAKVGGQDVAGIGPTQSPDQPSAWQFYVGTDDAEALGRKVEAAGGKVVAPPFDVGDQGKMAVFQHPSGAAGRLMSMPEWIQARVLLNSPKNAPCGSRMIANLPPG